jgi:tetratricopeptide (TPR) repeat protein
MRTPSSLRIVAGLVVWHLLGTPAFAENHPQPDPKIAVAFDQELFELAHSIFMANTNLTEALAVTERAIQALPHDRIWRAKGAQTAEWAGRSDLAIQHWFFLAQQGDAQAAQAALRISRSLNELTYRKQLLQKMVIVSTDLELQKEYLAVLEGLGLPDEAYEQFTSGKIRMVDPVWHISVQARLAEALGRPTEAYTFWYTRAALKPLNSDEALQLASLWSGQGNAAQALKVMRQAASSAPDTASLFWRTYTDLAWTLQEIPDAITGAELFIRLGTATELDYQRIQLTYMESDPARAYKIARAGWKNFPKPAWWYAMVDSGLRSDHANELIEFFKSMTPDERNVLSRDGRSWYYLSQVYLKTADREAALMAARIAIRCEPDNADLLSGYVWLLVDLKQAAELRILVREWETRINFIPELREPLAAAMLLLGEPGRALRHYRILARLRQNDPAWLTSYADVLEQAGHPEFAWQVRHHAQKLVTERIYSGYGPVGSKRRDLLTQAQLMMNLSPGDGLSSLIRRIANDSADSSVRELVMGWAMGTSQTDLARFWYWRNFARATTRPEWARLGLALEDNDRTSIADLIEASLEKLPYRDAVEGARRTGQTPLAESVAFENFQINDRDHLLDKQIRDLFSEHPAALRHRLTLQELGGIGFLEESLLFSYPVTNRVSLVAELNNTDIRHQKRGVLLDYPSSIRSGLLSLQLLHEKGKVELTSGVTDALYTFPSYALSTDWHLYSRLLLDVGLRFGWQATESAPLRIGGMKNEISAGLLTALTPRDSISTRLTYRNFRDQQRRILGNGLTIEGEGSHRLLLDWPDTNLRFFSSYNRFERSGTPVDRTLAMIPYSTADSGFYVPQTFTQIGSGINVGQYHRNSYSRGWLPFGGIDVSWNSASGPGFRYELGLVGPVFGLDKLEGAFSQESGSFGSSDVNTRVDFRYRFNLN